MDDRASYYFVHGLASSSLRTYQSGGDRYVKFCQSRKFVCMPVDETVLCSFMACLAYKRLKHPTIKTHLSGVRYQQIRSGLRDPF